MKKYKNDGTYTSRSSNTSHKINRFLPGRNYKSLEKPLSNRTGRSRSTNTLPLNKFVLSRLRNIEYADTRSRSNSLGGLSPQEPISLRLSKDKVYRGHRKAVLSLIYFGYPYFKLVSSSDDKEIRIWGLRSHRCLRTLRKHKGSVLHLIKFHKNTFLSCSADSRIFAWSIVHPYLCVKKFLMNRVAVNQLLKLDDDLFLCSNGHSDLIVISYKKRRIIKKLSKQPNWGVMSKLCLSLRFPNHFYMNCNDPRRTVKMINYTTNTVSKEFTDHSKTICTISVFQNSKQEEILCYGGYGKQLFFYNLGNDISKISEVKLFQKININEWINSSISLDSKYLCIGDSSGVVHIIDLEVNNTSNYCCEIQMDRKIHNGVVNNFQYFTNIESLSSLSSKSLPKGFSKKFTYSQKILQETENSEKRRNSSSLSSIKSLRPLKKSVPRESHIDEELFRTPKPQSFNKMFGSNSEISETSENNIFPEITEIPNSIDVDIIQQNNDEDVKPIFKIISCSDDMCIQITSSMLENEKLTNTSIHDILNKNIKEFVKSFVSELTKDSEKVRENSNTFNIYNGYKSRKFEKSELELMVQQIEEKSIEEYLGTSPNISGSSLYFEFPSYSADYKTFRISEYSKYTKKSEGDGVEFRRFGRSQNYHVYYLGEFKNGIRDGIGTIMNPINGNIAFQGIFNPGLPMDEEAKKIFSQRNFKDRFIDGIKKLFHHELNITLLHKRLVIAETKKLLFPYLRKILDSCIFKYYSIDSFIGQDSFFLHIRETMELEFLLMEIIPLENGYLIGHSGIKRSKIKQKTPNSPLTPNFNSHDGISGLDDCFFGIEFRRCGESSFLSPSKLKPRNISSSSSSSSSKLNPSFGESQKYSPFYIGNYRCGKFNGFGVLFDPQTSVKLYEGRFLDGMIDATSKFTKIREELGNNFPEIDFFEEFITQILEEDLSLEDLRKWYHHGIRREIYNNVYKRIIYHFRSYDYQNNTVNNKDYYPPTQLTLSSIFLDVSSGYFQHSEIFKEVRNYSLLNIQTFYDSLVTGVEFQEIPTKNEIYIGEVMRIGGKSIAHGFGILLTLRPRKNIFNNVQYYSPIYVGYFSNGVYHGEGKILDVRSKVYIFAGEFVNGVKEGKGIEYRYDKKGKYRMKEFEGLYKNNLREGRGELYDFKDRVFIQGVWQNNELNESFQGLFDDKYGLKSNKAYHKFRCPIISFPNVSVHLSASNILGQGAFGIVYKVPSSIFSNSNFPELRVKEEFVAIKIMRCKSNGERELLFDLTKRVICLCSRIDDCHNFLEVIGILYGYKHVGCIMPLCESSVDKIIANKKGKLDINEKIRILYQTAKGMLALHNNNIMHRDLKWGNVLVGFDKVVKITDTLKENERDWKLTIQTLTSKIGTPGFCAPEVFRGKEYGLECDVYSFGIMIYSLLFEVNQPYLTQFHCSCGARIEGILTSKSLGFHCCEHNFRPLLDPKKIVDFPRFLVDLMIFCWNNNTKERPTFKVICEILKNELEKERFKSYFIIEFVFPKYPNIAIQKMIVLKNSDNKYFSEVTKFLETKFEGSKVIYIDSDFGGIYEDEDLNRLIDTNKEPKLFIEFDKLVPIQKEANFDIEKNYVKLVEENEKLKTFVKEEKTKYEIQIAKLQREISVLKSKKSSNEEETEGEGED